MKAYASPTSRARAPFLAALLLALTGFAPFSPAQENLVFSPGDEWKAVDMSEVGVKAGSALDFSALLDGPAGKHGRVVTTPTGALAFADAPQKEIRFFGFSMWPGVVKTWIGATDEETRGNIDEFVRRMKCQGYNMLRLTGYDLTAMGASERDLEFDPVALDRLDYLYARLKAAGIYVHQDLGFSGLYFKGSWDEKMNKRDMKAEILGGDPSTRANWKEGVTRLLTRVNPYTKTRLVDDPMVVCLMFYNELEMTYLIRSGKYKASFEARWRAWLKKRYASLQDLAVAWKNPAMGKLGGFDEIPLGRYGTGPDSQDYAAFLHETFTEILAWFTRVVREIGYRGPVTQFDVGTSFFYTEIHDSLPLISKHRYFAHPHPGALTAGSKITQASHVKETGIDFRGFCGVRLWDRPFLVTEFNHGFWNRYQHEGGILFGAYGSLQNLNGMLLYANPVYLKVSVPMEAFRSGLSPVGRANEFLATCLYGRGDVAASPHRIELRLEPGFISNNLYPEANSEQTKLALLSGFGARYCPPGRPELARKADYSVLPAVGAATIATIEAATVEQSSRDSFSLANAVEALRVRGVLPAKNLTRPEQEVYQSDTGELILRARERRMTVITPRTEAVTLDEGGGADLSALKVGSTSAAACVSLSAMDGLPLRESRRLVLVYNTENANTGMETSADRTVMKKQGAFPPLMRTGRLSVSLENRGAAQLSVWALGFDGVRRERLEARVQGGRLALEMDTAKLKAGPTPFFEITKE
jgi:hypothetical protein